MEKLILAVLIASVSWIPLPAQQSDKTGTENSVTNIYDSVGAGKAGTRADWGFAVYVNYNGKKILFDTGMDPGILEQNTKALGIDLSAVDIAILSHAHNDHAAGFPYFLRVNSRARIYLPDDGRFFAAVGVLVPGASDSSAKLVPEERHYQGRKPQMQIKPADMFAGSANVEAVEESVEIAPGIFLIHTTSTLTGSFSGYPPHSPEKPELEGLPELSLALKTSRGLVVITGCSHSGAEVIVRTAKEFTGQEVELIEGGLHLMGYQPDYIMAVAKKLKDELGVRRVAPTHCTGETAIGIFHEVYGQNYMRTGLGSVVNF